MTTITRQQVRAALDALHHGRNGSEWRGYCRRILSRHGGGASSIEQLRPEFFAAVFAAAGGDLPPVLPSPQVFRHGGRRIQTPLVVDLEKRLREGVKHPRPTGFVNYGDRSLPGERRN
jgi:hypothetical protein